MELRHLRYFVATAEEENVSRAALRLHMSQPALSRQIRDLEEEMGFALLERTARAVRLTDAGRVFLKEAREVLQRADAAVDKARLVATGGHADLQVGYAPTPAARVLPAALRRFQTRAPKIRVRLHDLSSGEMVAGLRHRRLDIAILVRPTRGMMRGLRFEELVRDEMCLAVMPTHALARRRFVTIAQVAREPLVAFSRKDYPEYYQLLGEILAGAGVKPRIVEEHDSGASLIAAVEAGTGAAIASQSLACSAGPRLKLLAIKPPPPALIVGAAWLAENLSPTTQIFLNCARESVAARPGAD